MSGGNTLYHMRILSSAGSELDIWESISSIARVAALLNREFL